MSIQKTSLDVPKKIEVPQEPAVIKIVYVYVSVPKEYADDPFLDCKQVMAIMGWEKSKTYETMKKMTHYQDAKHLRVRRSWLDKWIKDHTEEPG